MAKHPLLPFRLNSRFCHGWGSQTTECHWCARMNHRIRRWPYLWCWLMQRWQHPWCWLMEKARGRVQELMGWRLEKTRPAFLGVFHSCLTNTVRLTFATTSVTDTCEMLSTREVSKRFGARVGIGSCAAKVPIDYYVPHLRLQAWKQMLHISDNVCAVWPQSWHMTVLRCLVTAIPVQTPAWKAVICTPFLLRQLPLCATHVAGVLTRWSGCVLSCCRWTLWATVCSLSVMGGHVSFQDRALLCMSCSILAKCTRLPSSGKEEGTYLY